MSLFPKAQLGDRTTAFISNDMSTIEGFLSADEATLFAILGQAQNENGFKGDIAEFGVWRGRSALVLHQLLQERDRLFAIDIFDLRDPAHPYFNDPSIFAAHCERLGATQGIEIIKADTTLASDQITAAIAPRSCRMVHVDGGHTYQVAKVDIDHAFRAVSEDGIIVCDDILAKKFPGVTQAFVEASLRNPDFVPIALSKKKVWTAHKKNSVLYKTAIKATLGKKCPTSHFMGGQMLVLH